MTGLNTDIFTGKEAAYSAVENAVNSLPFMSRRRLVLLRDTGLLSPGRKDDSELMCGLIPRVPESAVLLIVEREADRRMKLYKRIAEHGHVEEFNPPGEGQLVKWVGDICAQSGMKISRAACLELLRTVAPDMNTISAELRKLITISRKNLAKVRCPVLAVQSDKDQTISKSSSATIIRGISSDRSDTLRLKHAPHVVTLSDDLNIITEAIASFIQDV